VNVAIIGIGNFDKIIARETINGGLNGKLWCRHEAWAAVAEAAA
jgi:hypothetical protein